jgi:hypothetical protein
MKAIRAQSVSNGSAVLCSAQNNLKNPARENVTDHSFGRESQCEKQKEPTRRREEAKNGNCNGFSHGAHGDHGELLFGFEATATMTEHL